MKSTVQSPSRAMAAAGLQQNEACAPRERSATAGGPSNGTSELMRAHYRLQNGIFITELEDGPTWIRAFSKVSPAPIWNHAAWIGEENGGWFDFLQNTRAGWSKRDRRPTAYCLDELDSDGALEAAAKKAGFQRFDQESWMCYRGADVPCPSGSESLEVHVVERAGEIADFAAVFASAYQVPAAEFRELFLRDLGASDPRRLIRHYLGSADGEPVCIATLIGAEGWAGIYNVGTVPNRRKRGFAGQLLARAIEDALEGGNVRIFLQTETGSGAERLYLSLGFETAFVRTGYRLSEWLPPAVSGSRKAFLNAIRREDKAAEAEPLDARFEADCPVGLCGRVEVFAAQTGIRPEALWIAAWATLLARYSQETVISFGLRLKEGGLCPTNLELNESCSIETWLTDLDRQVDAQPRSSTDFSEADFESILSLSPSSTSTNRHASPCPLECAVPSLEADRLQVSYDRQRFEAPNVARLAGHLLTLVQGLVAQPRQSVSSLELLAAEERQCLLECARSDAQVAFEYRPIHRLFEGQAARTPDATAVLLGSTSLNEARPVSYATLDSHASEMACSLQARGVGPGAIVGVCMERSTALIAAVMAVFKSGAACLPLDPAYPAERLEFMLRDAGISMLISDQPSRRRLPDVSGLTVLLAGEDEAAGSEAAEKPSWPSQANDPAYVIYTSGSTGKPKGVIIPHEAIARHCAQAAADYALTSTDRVLQFNSLSFDAAFEQILSTLISGAALIVRGPELWTAKDFTEQLGKQRLTVVDLPTAFWHQVLEHWSQNRSEIPRDLPRLWIVGGEAMKPESLRLWRDLPLQKTGLINAYGPTETTITATAFEITGEWLSNGLPKRVPIGRPRGARTAYVVDSHGRLVPYSIPGELWIGGPLLASGYLNRPDLAQERFVRNPFTSTPGERLYRTGNLVRFLPDRNLEFIGRADQQVKIRGYRVEIGEIEAALCQYPAVGGAAVVVREQEGRKSLAAFVAPRNGSLLDDRELRSFLKKRLPDFMIPAAFATLDALPLLPGGKVDRQQLASASVPLSPSGSNGARTPLELQLQLLFERVLHMHGIAVDASFFELGGDSLQALSLILEIEQAAGRRLPLETLYQAPSVEALAHLLEKGNTQVQPSVLVPLQAGGSRPPLFLIHTTPGDVLGYGTLMYHLGSEQPCHGFQSLGLLEPERSHQRIEEMARHYVDELRCRFPKGPDYLAGWCYGGIVAVEMAQYLLSEGEHVAFLALLETVAPRPSPRIFRYYLHRFGCFAQMSPAQWVRYFRKKAAYRREVQMANRMRFRRLEASPSARDEMLEERNKRLARLEHVYTTNLQALRFYRPRFYPGRLTLFNAQEIDAGVIPDPVNAWAGLAADIEVRSVPGDHDSMLAEPNVALLARELDEALHRAQSEATPGIGRKSRVDATAPLPGL
ncbi:MAG: amino acid adenylation domain-containing protein [Verrucomicrobiia bacterium]